MIFRSTDGSNDWGFPKICEATKFRSQAEVEGGGFEYGAGWERRPGWTWQRPHGVTANDQEPAVHLNYAEAQAYCEWAGKRLPTDEEWASAAYHEQRRNPQADFEFGKVYDYPTGDQPNGANCLSECGPSLSVDHGKPASWDGSYYGWKQQGGSQWAA